MLIYVMNVMNVMNALLNFLGHCRRAIPQHLPCLPLHPVHDPAPSVRRSGLRLRPHLRRSHHRQRRWLHALLG